MIQAQIVEKRVKNQQASCSGFSQLGGLVFNLLLASSMKDGGASLFVAFLAQKQQLLLSCPCFSGSFSGTFGSRILRNFLRSKFCLLCLHCLICDHASNLFVGE